jgi:hypothetical protein
MSSNLPSSTGFSITASTALSASLSFAEGRGY